MKTAKYFAIIRKNYVHKYVHCTYIKDLQLCIGSYGLMISD